MTTSDSDFDLERFGIEPEAVPMECELENEEENEENVKPAAIRPVKCYGHRYSAFSIMTTAAYPRRFIERNRQTPECPLGLKPLMDMDRLHEIRLGRVTKVDTFAEITFEEEDAGEEDTLGLSTNRELSESEEPVAVGVRVDVIDNNLPEGLSLLMDMDGLSISNDEATTTDLTFIGSYKFSFNS